MNAKGEEQIDWGRLEDVPDATIGKAEPLVAKEVRRVAREKLEAAKTNITIGGQRYVAKQKNPYLPSKDALAAMWKEE